MTKALALVFAVAACGDTGGAPDANTRIDAPFVIDFDGPPPQICGNGMTATADEACTQPSWQFSTVEAGGGTFDPIACPASFQTAAIIGQKTSAKGVPFAPCDPTSTTNDTTCFVDLYDCNVQSGTQILPRGFATQQIAITNQDGTQEYGRSPVQFEIVTGTSFLSPFANILDNGGYIRAAWSLTRNGSPATCVSLGSNVDVTIATSLSFSQFPCDSGDDLFNYTGGHIAGTYTVTAQLVDRQSSQPIGNAATTQVVVGMHDDLPVTPVIAIAVP